VLDCPSIEGVSNRGDRVPDDFFAGSLTGGKEESGQRQEGRCQWFGITAYAQILIGFSSKLSRNTASNAW
jgi:hypothetical protein